MKTSLEFQQGPIHHRISFCRNVACIVAVITVIYFAFRYKDYNVINNKLLADIHRQNAELKNCLKDMGNNFNSHHPSSGVSLSDNSSCDETYCASSSDESDSYTTISSSSITAELPSADSGIFSNHIYETIPRTTSVTPDRSSTPIFQEMPSTGHYNLRPRRNRSAVENLTTPVESPRTFQRVIENLSAISRHNSRKIRRQQAHHIDFSDTDND